MNYFQAKEFSNLETVVLKIGLSPLVNTKFITHLTNSYKAQNSKHEILLIEENLSVLEDRLKNQELDLILVLLPLQYQQKHFLNPSHQRSECRRKK